MSNSTIQPKIYVACLSSYNAGILHGAWIDADRDADSIREEIAAMLAQSTQYPAEEWAIHEHEGLPGVQEYTDIDTIAAMAEFIGEHGELGYGLLDHYCGDLEDAQRAIDSYLGEYPDLESYCQEFTEETVEIPDSLKYYIDYESMARDWQLGGDVFTIDAGNGNVYIFSNH